MSTFTIADFRDPLGFETTHAEGVINYDKPPAVAATFAEILSFGVRMCHDQVTKHPACRNLDTHELYGAIHQLRESFFEAMIVTLGDLDAIPGIADMIIGNREAPVLTMRWTFEQQGATSRFLLLLRDHDAVWVECYRFYVDPTVITRQNITSFAEAVMACRYARLVAYLGAIEQWCDSLDMFTASIAIAAVKVGLVAGKTETSLTQAISAFGMPLSMITRCDPSRN